MGVILSKFRRAKPSLENQLEKIDKELHEIRRFQIDTEVQQKRIIGRLSIVAFIVYALSILAYYLFIHTETFTWGQHALSLLPFVIFPLIIWSLRRLFGWWYHRKIEMNKEKSDTLRKDKERLLDEVMDTETFKVAKKILEKYAPSHLLPKYLADQQRAGGTPISSRPAPIDNLALRRRTMGGPSVSPQGMRMGQPFPPGYRPPLGAGRPPMPQFRPQQQAIMPAGATPMRFRGATPGMSSVPTGYTPMRYMLPQAPSAPTIHNRKTGWLDKLVDYVVADGPAHRFALICRYCATHNGLATPDDFPYTGYRCIYCRQFNPPRQQRPSAATLPRNTVLIEEMDSSINSGTTTANATGDEDESGDDQGPGNTSQNIDSDTAGEPLIELGDSSDAKSDGEEETRPEEEPPAALDDDENVPFMDDNGDEEENSVVENKSIPIPNGGEENSVVGGKLEVNLRTQGQEILEEEPQVSPSSTIRDD